jgi:hypothetical protein
MNYDVSLSDWQTFDREFLPLIGEVIDRDAAKLPDWLVPVAHGVFIADDALLRAAGHRDGMRRPRGWREAVADARPIFGISSQLTAESPTLTTAMGGTDATTLSA